MRLPIAAAVMITAIALTGCAKDAAKADLDQPKVQGDVMPSDFVMRAPDKVTIFNNVDSHPNIVRLCIDGIAFRTVSSTYAGLATPAVDRVPEWDTYCKAP